MLRKILTMLGLNQPARPITPDIICPDCGGIGDGPVQFHWDACELTQREWARTWAKIMAEPIEWD